MVNSAIGPSIDTSEWAFLSDSLKIVFSAAKNGITKRDEHFGKARNFYDCLIKLKERCKVDFDPEIFTSFLGNINYVQVQTKLMYYCLRNSINYETLLNNLIKTNKNILEEKVISDNNQFYNVANYLGQRNFEQRISN